MERRQELRQHKPLGPPFQPTRNVAQLNSHINLLIRVTEKITNFVFAHTNQTQRLIKWRRVYIFATLPVLKQCI
jgi:hypothetical protein